MSEEVRGETEELAQIDDVQALEPQHKVSKLELKRQAIFNDRVRRYMKDGMDADSAIARVRREDYERLPVEQKIKKLEGMFVGNVQGLGQDMAVLRKNQVDLADVMDVNFRAFEKMLAMLGLPVEKQREVLAAAEAEWKLEQQAQNEARAAAEAQQQEAQQKQTVVDTVDQPGEPAPAPAGATVFGG